MPELVGLRSRGFRVAFTDNDQRRGLYILDKLNGRTFLEHGGIIVNGRAEEGDHPLIDQVLAIITLPVGNTSAGNRGVETVGLRDSPHRHEAAVTPPRDAETVGVNWILLYCGIDAGEIVA